jgi:hypothetical protein
MASKDDKKKAKKMAEKGKTPEQIKAKTGVGSATANRYVEKRGPSSSPAPRPAPAPAPAPRANDRGPAGNTASRVNPGISTGQTAQPKPKIGKDNSLSQNLRIAGGNNNISKSELSKIAKKNDVSVDKVIQRLDKLNSKNKDLKIGLGSGAVNAYTKGKLGNARDFFWNMAGNATFGTQGSSKIKEQGKIASTLNDYLGSTSPMVKGKGGQFNNGVTAGRLPAITAGNQINAKGGITTKPTFYGAPPKPVPTPTPTPTPEPTTPPQTTPGGDGEDVLPIIPEPEPVDTSLSSGAGGLDLASWATGFRRARSARQKAGRGAQGLASQKKSPFKSWNA